MDLKFVSTLAEGIEIPYGTRLEGKFTMAGTKMGTDLLLMQPEAQAVVAADTIPITVYNDSISVADDFKMERAARLLPNTTCRVTGMRQTWLSIILTCTSLCLPILCTPCPPV